MILRGKIAWMGILLLTGLAAWRGQDVLYRVWTTRTALATEDSGDARRALEKELSALPARRAALMAQKRETDAAASVLNAKAQEQMQHTRRLRRERLTAERSAQQAQQTVRSATRALIASVRRSGEKGWTIARISSLLGGKKALGLPPVFSALAEALEAAHDHLEQERGRHEALARAAREAFRSERNLQAAHDRLRTMSQRLGREIAALDRRELLLGRRLVRLDKRSTILREAAPQPARVLLRGSASLSGSLSDATTPLLYSDLTQDQSTLDAFLSESAKSQKKLEWPISPAISGISAYYHDELYVARMGQDHFAIDIVAKQGTEIIAPADALVLKAEDSGTGFQYVLLLHKNGYMTLYGHVSSFAAEAGDLVRRGAIIAFSGGQPGTAGAGKNTTGPHLHFEVWKDNKRLDPLQYLDLSKLPNDPARIDPEQIPQAPTQDLDS